MIHDAQMDFYGKRLATCSSDCSVKLFEVVGETQKLIKELRGHDSPVWQVSWAHPKFGNIIASCSFDRKVIVWKESSTGWENTYEHLEHSSSVNAIAWLPFEYDILMLACASSDGKVSIIYFHEGAWKQWVMINAHASGAMALDWAPIGDSNVMGSSEESFQLVTGGCDKTIRLWSIVSPKTSHQVTTAYDVIALNTSKAIKHTDWIRDVAWCPNLGLTSTTIASCGQDGRVILWSKDNSSNPWEVTELIEASDVAMWRLSWSLTGSVLAVSSGDNKVRLFKQASDGQWGEVSTINEPSTR
eukprot:m.66413 g.66413  ORF g.66413 m.66413 type:complete len:301 (+) comp14052_c0_seq1:92-994(+)